MTFLGRRHNKHRFKVVLGISEIKDVPFASGVYFFKIRLLDGGHFEANSRRSGIVTNRVSWEEEFRFECKMGADPATRILDDCRCRISFRRETKGGRGKDKLGFVDLNLSEHAAGSPDAKPYSSSTPGGGPSDNERLHSYLFRGYNNSEQRDANYVLKIRVKMSLLSGDLVFKTPSPALTGCRIPVGFDDNLDGTLESTASATMTTLSGGFSRMGHWMTASTRRSWIAGSLKDMLRREDAASKKRTEWFLHPNLEAEGAVVHALETEENMADSLLATSDDDPPPTPSLKQQQKHYHHQQQHSSPYEPSSEAASTPRIELVPSQCSDKEDFKDAVKDADRASSTPERPPRRRNTRASHSRQTSSTSSTTMPKGHSRQTSWTSSVSGYSSLASSHQFASSSTAGINSDLEGGSGDGGGGSGDVGGSVESLPLTPSPPSKDSSKRGGDDRTFLDFDAAETLDHDAGDDRKQLASSSSTLASGLRTPTTKSRLATTPASLRTKTFFPNFSADGGGVATPSSTLPKSRNELMAQTRVSSDEVVDEILFGELS